MRRARSFCTSLAVNRHAGPRPVGGQEEPCAARVGKALVAFTRRKRAHLAAGYLVTVIERRKLRGLAAALAAYGSATHDQRARTLAAWWAPRSRAS